MSSFTQIPSPPRRLGSSHPLSHWLARSSVFPVPPAGYPRFYTALPFCVLLLGRDLAIILPSAEKRSTYPSFSTGSFPFQRTPHIRDPRRGSDWESLSFFRLRRPSLHTAFTSGGALNSHNPILPQTLRDWHLAAFCGAAKDSQPPPPPPSVLGTPLTSAVRDVFTEESLLLSLMQQGRVFKQQE